ncbi:MAG: alpha-1,4-glucan--maltose-1-phosphate maltosyltransferase [Vulcanimicrobiaceae bacterium]
MGPRVYNLFPTLAGPLSTWPSHFERIAAMGFNWLYVNPIHVTGGSGSLYAVADYYRLNPLLRTARRGDDDDEVRTMVAAARTCGLDVMLDLVLNHTANDSPLVAAHPGWYARDAAGIVRAPFATDPETGATTTWGDLAELDFSDRPERAEIVDFFARVVRHYVGLGVRGFRCDAAYQVPGDVWAALIAAARQVAPQTVFAAETLGAELAAIAQLGPAGFDFFFNSSKWWDFRASWLLDQYERFRHIAPSIAFPESHDTPRLAAELAASDDATIEAEYRFRYLFAAFFSSGVMMPMGYEYGFARKLDVVTTRPEDWETPRFDLQAFIADVNAMKAALPALNAEGAERIAPIGRDAIALVRSGATERDIAVAVLNPSSTATVRVETSVLVRTLAGTPRDVTPHVIAKHRVGDSAVDLEPWEMRVFAREEVTSLQVHAAAAPDDGRATPPTETRAVAIERVTPQLDGGRFPVKRVIGETAVVEADVFRDGHDALAARLLYRSPGAEEWLETAFEFLDNDRYRGSFALERPGRYDFTIEAWPDAFATWRHDAGKKRAAGQPLATEIVEGRRLVAAAAARATAPNEAAFSTAIRALDACASDDARADVLLGDGLAALVARAPDRSRATRYAPELALDVDRTAAQFSSWYEFFPRSSGATPGRHGTFADAARRLPAIAEMGFDIVYLPPIHPIGRAFRKGPNNSLEPGPDDPGSPWAIGNADGGHTAVEPQLGTLADFETFVAAARAQGLEVALDYALQCSPDHPYVREHPEWFAFRSDGTIKYAENPPKKYQDIVNFDWYGPAAPALYAELRDVVEFWIARGVRVFRVDNPHTKPFTFWEWMIADVRSRHPETIFLAEAFTRPKVMARLAKAGFSQSYTYFTWRNTKDDLTAYMTELASSDMANYFRPNFWPNTPDILPPFLQTGGRAAFRIRLALAATLASSYGIYSGYELCENAGLPGREEYADSEKYQLRQRDFDGPESIAPEIARINAIRRENPALHDWRNITFYRADDDAVLFYGKRTGDNVLLVAVNLDPFAARDALLWLPTGDFGIADDETYALEELLGQTRHLWRGSPHRWRLDPQTNPVAIFRIDVSAR